MRKLERSDIMDYLMYQEMKEEFRLKIYKMKKARRIFLGDKLLFIFDNTEMVKNRILETIEHEKLFLEQDLVRQLDFFNPLIAGPGELRCSMIVLNDDLGWEKSKRIKFWHDLAAHIYFVLDNGTTIYAEKPQISELNQHPCSMRLLKFFCGNHFPIKIGSDYFLDSEYQREERLTNLQQQVLREDLNILQVPVATTIHYDDINIYGVE